MKGGMTMLAWIKIALLPYDKPNERLIVSNGMS